MRVYLLVVGLIVVLSLIGPTSYVVAERYAQCDPCGLCKDTARSKVPVTPPVVVYVMPANWESCATCIYGDAFTNASPVVCGQDQQGRQVVFQNMAGTPLPASESRCDTLIMAPIPTISPGPNQPRLRPLSGRKYSDMGCIEAASGSFLGADASVDVVQRLLSLIISITGGVGFFLIMSSALKLLTSRGDPEKIREGKKALTNVILGVIFALFALFIFRFVAADVLHIPGLSTTP